MNTPEPKTNVRRFEPCIGIDPLKGGSDVATMTEDTLGSFVRISDYADLRAKLATLEAERDEATLKAVEECDAKHLAWNKSEALEAEVQKLREALDAIDEQAETGIASERLGGNCVKEEFYKGQLSVVRQLRRPQRWREGGEAMKRCECKTSAGKRCKRTAKLQKVVFSAGYAYSYQVMVCRQHFQDPALNSTAGEKEKA